MVHPYFYHLTFFGRLSLVRFLSVDEKKKRLYLEGIDIVNGSPVYGEVVYDTS